MEVESKFSIGDKVWCIYSNKVLCQDVTGVSILLSENAEPVIKYILIMIMRKRMCMLQKKNY